MLSILLFVLMNVNLSAQLIHIHTAQTSLIYQFPKDKKVVLGHYGKRIDKTNRMEQMVLVFNETYLSSCNTLNFILSAKLFNQ